MILSIESSCDDSSIAITNSETLELVYHKKISQELQHSAYGGVVPELAARLHIEALPKILEECLEYFPKLKAIAVTTAPGLSVTLMEGVTMAKALSISLNIPLISVNHLKGHIYSLFIEKEEVLPMTILLVSGGHTQIIEANSLNEMNLIASTMDDSFGESFDKVSKMLGLGYPGGPVVQEYALKGDENRFELPVPLRQSPYIEFSYSGLKNAVSLNNEVFKAPIVIVVSALKATESNCPSLKIPLGISHAIFTASRLFKSSIKEIALLSKDLFKPEPKIQSTIISAFSIFFTTKTPILLALLY